MAQPERNQNFRYVTKPKIYSEKTTDQLPAGWAVTAQPNDINSFNHASSALPEKPSISHDWLIHETISRLEIAVTPIYRFLSQIASASEGLVTADDLMDHSISSNAFRDFRTSAMRALREPSADLQSTVSWLVEQQGKGVGGILSDRVLLSLLKAALPSTTPENKITIESAIANLRRRLGISSTQNSDGVPVEAKRIVSMSERQQQGLTAFGMTSFAYELAWHELPEHLGIIIMRSDIRGGIDRVWSVINSERKLRRPGSRSLEKKDLMFNNTEVGPMFAQAVSVFVRDVVNPVKSTTFPSTHRLRVASLAMRNSISYFLEVDYGTDGQLNYYPGSMFGFGDGLEGLIAMGGNQKTIFTNLYD